MSVEEQKASGAAPDGSGASKGEGGQPEKEQQVKTVAWDDHKRALDDLQKFKRKSQELDERLNAFEAKALAEKEDYKTLAEKRAQELEETKQKLKSRDDAYVYEKKYSQVLSKAKEVGLMNADDLDLLDLGQVQAEYTSEGRIIVNGVDDFVEGLKKTRPHWFQNGKVPKFNSGGAQSKFEEPEQLTAAKYIELESKYKRENKREELKSLQQRFLKQKGFSI